MSADYRILSYRDGAEVAAGVLVDGRVYPARACLADATDVDTSSVLGLLRSWDRVRTLLREWVPQVRPSDGIALDAVALEAPVRYPPAIFCSWGNFSDHLAEMAAFAGRSAPVIDTSADPFFIVKTGEHSVIGTGAPIRYPSFTQQLDYEAEIGVVIGREVRNVSGAEADAAVAGIVIMNDLSARDIIKRTEPRMAHLHDWLGQKCFEDSAPMGPWLTPMEFVRDPYDLGIKLWVNGELRQDGSSKSMVYTIAENVAYLSRRFTLRPGDVIMLGCPAGVGVTSGRFLVPGDEIRIEVEGCGTLVNRVVA